MKKSPCPCVYCGTAPATTMDHVIPKCLFVPPLPAMVTVPVCGGCNSRKSLSDSELRDRLVMDLYCSEHPQAKRLMGSTVVRAVRKNRSRLARAAVRGARRKPVYTPAGLYLGHAYAIPYDDTPLNETFETIVRGLYFHRMRTRIPDGYRFVIGRLERPNERRAIDAMKAWGAADPHGLGEVFWCMYVFDSGDRHTTRWLLCFFGGFLVTVDTYPQHELRDAETPPDGTTTAAVRRPEE